MERGPAVILGGRLDPSYVYDVLNQRFGSALINGVVVNIPKQLSRLDSEGNDALRAEYYVDFDVPVNSYPDAWVDQIIQVYNGTELVLETRDFDVIQQYGCNSPDCWMIAYALVDTSTNIAATE